MPLRVLVVARWYPSHDQPGRGSFVADHVAALTAAGVEAVVASFDTVRVRGAEGTRPERGSAAAAAFARAVASPDAVSAPRSWGAPGVPVARLPIVLDGSRRAPKDVIDAHGAVLVPFGGALMERWPFELIHAHTGLPDGVAAAGLADRLGLPLVVTEHSSTIEDELADASATELYRTLLTSNRRLVAVSRSLAAAVERALGEPAGTIAVVPNAVPVDDFPLGEAVRDPDELVYVGARKATKGIETLLRAFALTCAERQSLHLRLIGSTGQGGDEERWHELAASLGIGEAVRFEAPASRAGVAEAMRRAAIFVHPSPRETFGMVAAEALASGLPVAATPSGGVEEIVGEAPFGAIAESNDPAALATAIARLLDRRDAIDPTALRARVVEMFAAPAVAERTLAVYRELGDKPPPSRRPKEASASPRAGHHMSSVRPPLIVALSRAVGPDQLAGVPTALAQQLTGVTSVADSSAGERDASVDALPAIGQWLELDAERPYRERWAALQRRPGPGALGRVVGLIQEPVDRLRRRRLFAQRARIREETVTHLLWTAYHRAGQSLADHPDPDDPRLVLAIDADDVIALAPLFDRGVRLAPGAVRWLVDRWDAAGRP